MKDTLSKIIIFAAGACVGSAVTWKLVKNKYERIAQEEIDSVKEVFSQREIEHSEPKEKIATNMKVEKPNLKEYVAKIQEENYAEYSGMTDTKKEVADVEKPYVITRQEFDEFGYDVISLTYYADGVLADDADEIIDDIDDIVGVEALTRFGEDPEDPDSVYVRNDRLKCDYEILLDNRNYADVAGDAEEPPEEE